jgi:hypothetical protein
MAAGLSGCEHGGEDGSAQVVPAAPGMSAQAGDFLIFLNEVVDPWLSDGLAEPDERTRLVAFNLTVMNTADATSYFWADWSDPFKLSDADGFAHERLSYGPTPALTWIELGSGQKTQGWVTFAVNIEASLKAFEYQDVQFRFGGAVSSSDDVETINEETIVIGEIDETELRNGFVGQAIEAGATYERATCVYDVLRSHYPPETLWGFVEGYGDVDAFVEDVRARYGSEWDACG